MEILIVKNGNLLQEKNIFTRSGVKSMAKKLNIKEICNVYANKRKRIAIKL
jgi:hypothetical protein